MKDATHRLAEAVYDLSLAVEALKARVQALEGQRADLERRHELVQAASRSWRALCRARTDLVVVSDAGAVAHVPVPLARLLAAGRPLDVQVRDLDPEQVELVDAEDRRVTVLPRAAFLALPRVLAQPDATRLLGLAVQVQPGQTVEARP